MKKSHESLVDVAFFSVCKATSFWLGCYHS